MTRPEHGATWASKYKLALSLSKRVAAWEIKELRQVFGLDRENPGLRRLF